MQKFFTVAALAAAAQASLDYGSVTPTVGSFEENLKPNEVKHKWDEPATLYV